MEGDQEGGGTRVLAFNPPPQRRGSKCTLSFPSMCSREGGTVEGGGVGAGEVTCQAGII